MKTSFLVTVGACAALAVVAQVVGASRSWAQSGAPHYEVDASWPKPLPDRWVLGGLGGVCVDAQDHVVILNRQDILEGELDAGRMAPSIIEFDPAGNVVHSWSNPDLLDPRLHSCHFDKENNFWVASAPSGVVQKFTHDGSKLLLRIGKKGVLDSSDGTIKGRPLNSSFAQFHMPSSIFVDRDNGDVYVSDGEGRNSTPPLHAPPRHRPLSRHCLPEAMHTGHCLPIRPDGPPYACKR